MGKESIAIRSRFTAVPPVAVDGDFPYILVDASGAIIVSPSAAVGVTTFDSGADVTNIVASAVAATLFSIYGFNNSGAVRFVHFFDLAALPANGTAPDWVPIRVPDQADFALIFAKGYAAAAGIVVASSSTYATLTITLGADMWFSGEYL